MASTCGGDMWQYKASRQRSGYCVTMSGYVQCVARCLSSTQAIKNTVNRAVRMRHGWQICEDKKGGKDDNEMSF